MNGRDNQSDGDRCADILTRVHLPLENLEFTIDSFLQDNGSFLDRQTRTMLIGVRENVHRVALSARRLATEPANAAGDGASAPAAEAEAEAESPDLAVPPLEMLATGG